MSLSDVIENYQASFVPPVTLPGPYRSKQFPARYLTSDPKEKRMVLKLNFIKSLAAKMGHEPLITYTPGEEELQTVKHFQGQLTQAALDQWVWQMYDPPRDPGMGWVFANNFPEQRQRMIDLLNLKHDIFGQLMILKTKSFPDENDAILLFVINYMDPTDRQRFLTWLVGNDRSPEVLKAMVGPVPTFPREHSQWINSFNINMAGAPKNLVVRENGNVIENRLWRRMRPVDVMDEESVTRKFPHAENTADVLRLFDQGPPNARRRVDYTKATPYTANVISSPLEYPDGRTRIGSLVPRSGWQREASFFSGRNVQDRIDQMMSGLNLNQ